MAGFIVQLSTNKILSATMKTISDNQDPETQPVQAGKEKRSSGPGSVKSWNIPEYLFEHAWDAWIVTDLNFIVLRCNAAAEKMYGWQQHEIIDHAFENLIFTAVPAGTDHQAALQHVLENGHWQGRGLQTRANGSVFPLMASVSLLKDDCGNPAGLIAIYRDLTAELRSEEKLLQYRKILDETNDAVFLIDPVTSRYLDFNLAATKMLGYPPSELLQLGAVDIAHHLTSLQFWHTRVELIREQKGLIFETTYRRKDQTNFPVEVSARMMGLDGQDIMIAVVRDITRRKQDEADLQKSELLYRLLAENSSDAVSLYGPDGKILYISPAYGRLLGYTEQESRKFDHTEIAHIVHPEDRRTIFELVSHGNQEKLPLNQYTYRAQTKQGEYIWLEDILRRKFDENGQIAQVIVNTRDVTRRIQDEIVLRKNEERFRSLAENIPSFIYVLA
jgi:PAS domain S-box-containing protein